MKVQVKKIEESKRQSVANAISKKQHASRPSFQFTETVAKGYLNWFIF